MLKKYKIAVLLVLVGTALPALAMENLDRAAIAAGFARAISRPDTGPARGGKAQAAKKRKQAAKQNKHEEQDYQEQDGSVINVGGELIGVYRKGNRVVLTDDPAQYLSSDEAQARFGGEQISRFKKELAAFGARKTRSFDGAPEDDGGEPATAAPTMEEDEKEKPITEFERNIAAGFARARARKPENQAQAEGSNPNVMGIFSLNGEIFTTQDAVGFIESPEGRAEIEKSFARMQVEETAQTQSPLQDEASEPQADGGPAEASGLDQALRREFSEFNQSGESGRSLRLDFSNNSVKITRDPFGKPKQQ